MNFDTYFGSLVTREGEWLRPAKHAIEGCWPHVPAERDRPAVALYEAVFGKADDDDLPESTLGSMTHIPVSTINAPST